MASLNGLAYYNAATIAAIKSFIVQVLGGEKEKSIRTFNFELGA